MKKLGVLFVGVAMITLVTGCGNKETNKTLVCTNTQTQSGMEMEQKVSMTFKNDKVNHVTMTLENTAKDDNLKAGWSTFISVMDSQYQTSNQEGVSLKVNNDDKNYVYTITLDIDLDKADKDVLTTYGLSALTESKEKLADVKKSAEADGFTCKEQ